MQALSALPRGEEAHYVLQRYVARSLPVPDSAFLRKARRAARHLGRFEQHGPRRDLADVVHYEFGAGWDLIGPLTLWTLGIERQILVDIRPNGRRELVADTVARLEERHDELERELGRPLRRPGGRVRSLADLEPRFGIRYLAPRDARSTGLPDACVDFVSSTNTLEHVPADDLRPLLRECRRLLRPDGVMSSRIDLHDHFADRDPAISPYNFLRYRERTWRMFNSALLHQNRLRRPDYLEAFATAGLTVVAEEAATPTEADLAALAEVRPAAEFRGYAFEDLGVKGLFLVAQPAAARSPDALEELEDLGRRSGTGVGPRAVPHGGRLGDQR